MGRTSRSTFVCLLAAASIFVWAVSSASAQTPPRTILYYAFVPGTGYVPVYAPLVRAAAPEATPTYGAAPQSGQPSYYTEDNPLAEDEKPDQKLPARIRVRLPADAEITINGKKTTSTGPVREYETPLLEPDRVYSYLVKAKWLEDGITVEKSLRVRALSGNRVTINFVPPAEVRPQPLRVPTPRVAEARSLPPVSSAPPAQWTPPYP